MGVIIMQKYNISSVKRIAETDTPMICYSLPREILVYDLLEDEKESIYAVGSGTGKYITLNSETGLTVSNSIFVPFLKFESMDQENKIFIDLVKQTNENNLGNLEKIRDIVKGFDRLESRSFLCKNIILGTSVLTKVKQELGGFFDSDGQATSKNSLFGAKIHVTNLIDKNEAFYFAGPEHVGVMPYKGKEFGMAILNSDSIVSATFDV